MFITDLLAGIVELYDGTVELTDGTGEMRDETDGMDDKINDKIDEMLESITGDNTEIVSFVSDKNINVESVQFVIQTEAVEVEEAVTVESDATETLSFWQKLLKLFGLN